MRIRQMGFSSRLIAHRHLLTLKTLKFIVEFLDDGNATQAAIRSGIPQKYASRQGLWLKKLPMVKKALESEINERDLKKLQNALKVIDDKMLECRAILNLNSTED